jgi:hypothetical protein
MASKSSVSARLKKLAKEIPSDTVAHDLLSRLEDIPYFDHAAATMGASLIEKALEVAILSRLIPMNDDDRKRLFDYDHRGPLADLSARIRMGRVLGLYGPHTMNDLTKIREIRNAFAHSLYFLTFTTDEVAGMCDFHALTVMSLLDGGGLSAPRSKYIRTVIYIASKLKERITFLGVAGVPYLPPPRRELP